MYLQHSYIYVIIYNNNINYTVLYNNWKEKWNIYIFILLYSMCIIELLFNYTRYIELLGLLPCCEILSRTLQVNKDYWLYGLFRCSARPGSPYLALASG